MRMRHDVTATVRRALAACGRRSFVAVCLGMGTFASLVTAIWASDAFALVAVVAVVVAAAAWKAPDHVFEEPDPVFERGKIRSDGMTEHEVAVRLGIVDERAKYKDELAEEERKKAKREAKNRDANRRKPFG